MNKDLYQETFAAQEEGFSDSVQAHMHDGIARVEALKLRVLSNDLIPYDERDSIISELNTIRADYLHFGSIAGMPRKPKVPAVLTAAPNERTNLELLGILGQNRIITNNLKKIARIAPTGLPVLLEGETGAGKDLFARIIHLNSDRSKFIAINCGALPADIVESELFGHVKGAFTGAISNRKGKLEEAAGGTIFLDEIGDLEPQVQVKLLRVLDSGEIQRVGSDSVLHTDVRVIAATNRDLETMVREGGFREDLFYRLNACHFYIPPLRERRDEIELLFEWFAKKTCESLNKPLPKLDARLRAFLFYRYDFTGNIRELKNLAEYVSHVARGEPVTIEDLPDRYIREHERMIEGPDVDAADETRHKVKDTAESAYLTTLIQTHRGSVQKVCEELGLSRSRVYQLLKKHGIKPTDFKHAQAGSET